MQILDSLIDGPLQLSDTQEADELIGMIVRWLRTGAEPNPRTDAQRMALAMVAPVIERSRARMLAGSKGGSHKEELEAATGDTDTANDCDKQTESKEQNKDESKADNNSESKAESKQPSKHVSKSTSKQLSKTESKQPSKPISKSASDIYSSSSSSIPQSKEGKSEGEEIPYETIVCCLNDAAGTAYKPGSKKTRTLIHARWAEGFRLADFEQVINTMVACWAQDERMSCYLRPETLFGTKFESYLNRQKPRKQVVKDDVFAAY